MKYIFTVIVQPSQLKEISTYMKNLDLYIGEVGIEQTFTFTGKDKDVECFKQEITTFLESEGITVLKIEGGKIE